MSEEEGGGVNAKCCSCRSLALPVSLAASQETSGEQRERGETGPAVMCVMAGDGR